MRHTEYSLTQSRLSAFELATGDGNYRDADDGGRIDTGIAGMLRFPRGATVLFDTGVNLERRNFPEITGTDGRLNLDSPFSLLEEDSVLEEHHFGQDMLYHQIKGENHFVRMGEYFADSVLKGTSLRYGLTEAANNAGIGSARQGSAETRRASEQSPYSGAGTASD